MLNLQPDSIEWALSHLRKYYDSDFFPRLFEFSAIAHNWPHIRGYIQTIDLEQYTPKSPLTLSAPKPNWNFRIVHQLDPIDSIIYTGLIYEIANDISAFRDQISRGRSLSYSINISDQGDLFSGSSTYKAFLDRESELISEFRDGYILLADIADFYNQIYIHRIQNLISEASMGRLETHSRCVERFLLGLNRGSSKGIPVGPSASIVLAEIILADIDRKISAHSADFIRYVDDLRIFFRSKSAAIATMEELSRYLYSYHRLILSSSKTGLMSTAEYENRIYSHEERTEERSRQSILEGRIAERIEEILSEIEADYDGYYLPTDFEEKLTAQLTQEEAFTAQSESYAELFRTVIESGNINYSMLRHLLKKSTRYRVKSLIGLVFDNIEKLYPVYREAIIYLHTVISKKKATNYRYELASLWKHGYANLPFVEKWNTYLFSDSIFANLLDMETYNRLSTLRNKAILARHRKDVSWIRSQRDNVHSLGSWDRWGLLYASGALPGEERKHWLNTLSQSLDILDQTIISRVKDEQS